MVTSGVTALGAAFVAEAVAAARRFDAFTEDNHNQARREARPTPWRTRRWRDRRAAD